MKNDSKELTAVSNAASMVALGVFPPRFRGQDHRSLSMFVIDGKGVLWEDAVKLALDSGWKWRVIGIEDGEYGLDLCDGLEPSAIVAAIKDATSQVSGGGKEANPIFKDMAVEIIRACLNVSRAYELTNAGLQRVTEKKERLYSLSHAYELAQSVLDPAGKLFKVVDAICRSVADQVDSRNIAPLLTSDLWADIAFLRRDLLKSYPRETVGSFLTNVHQMLAGFVTNPAIRARFGAARGSQLEIDDVWDDKTVTCFRLSPQTGVGDTAKMVAILTKIRIYNRAGVRQLIDKNVGTKAKLCIVMDEAQELVTNGTMGEAAVTAWTRSTGLSFIFATQSLNGFYTRIGKEGTHALLSNMRSKVFLQVEEPEDQQYVMHLAGKVRRSLVSAADEYESWHMRQLEVNGSIDDDVVAAPLEGVNYSLTTRDCFGAPQAITPRAREIKAFDKHNKLRELTGLAHASKHVGGGDLREWQQRMEAANATAEYQALQAELGMLHRQEDQTRAFLSAGNEKAPLFTEEDLSGLGMGQAIVFLNRAGVMRRDIIMLRPELATAGAGKQPTIDGTAREVKVSNAQAAQIAQSAADVVLQRRAQMQAGAAAVVSSKDA